MNAPDAEPLKKKLAEIDQKISVSTYLLFSYVHALVGLLHDKELTNQDEFNAYLERSKKELLKMNQDAQFLEAMKAFSAAKDGGEGKPKG